MRTTPTAPSPAARAGSRTKLALTAMALAGTLILAACQSFTSHNPGMVASGPGGNGQSADVPLQGVNGGPSGSATLLESPTLVLSVTLAFPAPASGTPEEPAAIEPGTCANPVPTPTFPLAPVAAGKSSTSNLNTSLDELESTPHVILVERSAVDNTLVSCGTIPQVTSTATP